MLFKDTKDASTKIIQEKRNICSKVATVKHKDLGITVVIRKLSERFSASISGHVLAGEFVCLNAEATGTRNHLYCLQSSSITDELLAVHMHGV